MANKKIKHVQTIFRNIRGLSLRDIEERTGHHINSISLHEQLKDIPRQKTILNVSNILEINPNILYYAYGNLPAKILDMIKSDPFYYMEKIEKLYYNHDMRYKNEDIDLNKLNGVRALEYIVKDSKNDKD